VVEFCLLVERAGVFDHLVRLLRPLALYLDLTIGFECAAANAPKKKKREILKSQVDKKKPMGRNFVNFYLFRI